MKIIKTRTVCIFTWGSLFRCLLRRTLTGSGPISGSSDAGRDVGAVGAPGAAGGDTGRVPPSSR